MLTLIKINLKTLFLYQFWLVLIGFIATPLLLILFLTFIGSDGFTETLSIPEIKMEIMDQDETELSRQFIQLFEGEPFQITEENPMYQITIPEGYEAGILRSEPVTIKVEELENNPAIVQQVMEATIEQYNQILSTTMLAQGTNVDMEQLLAIYQGQSFEKEFVTPENKLSLFEENAILFSGFTVIMVVLQIAGSSYGMEGTGIEKRMHSIPLTKAQLFHYSIIQNFTVSFGILALTILVYSFFGEHFRVNFLYFIHVIGILSVLTVALGQLVGEFLSKTIGSTILTLVLIVDMVLATINLEEFTRYMPTQLIHQLYRGALEGNLEHFGIASLIIFGIFLASYLAVRIKLAVIWGRQ